MRRNPFEELEEMLDRMSRQVEEGMTGGPGVASTPVNVRDEGDAYVVTADLPGYEPGDVDLTLSGKRLSIAAERTTEAEAAAGDDGDGGEEADEEAVTYVRRERTTTSVERTVSLPDPVEEEGIEANLADGVLTVRLPKVETDEGYRIEIEG